MPIFMGGKPQTEGLQPGMMWGAMPDGSRVAIPIPNAADLAAAAKGKEAKASKEGEQAGDRTLNLKLEDDLRKEFNEQPVVRQRNEAASSFNAAVSTAGRGTPASDEALANFALKVFDPGQVVSGTSAERVQGLQGVTSRVSGILSRAMGGSGLQPTERQELLDAMQDKMGALDAQHAQIANSYRNHASGRGLNPDTVAPAMPVVPGGQQVPYAPGGNPPRPGTGPAPASPPPTPQGGAGTPPPQAGKGTRRLRYNPATDSLEPVQ
jgi:hypothetical protein